MALSGQFKNMQTIVRFHGEEQKDCWIIQSEALVVVLSPALSFFTTLCINVCSVLVWDVDLPVVTKRFLTLLTVTFSMWSLLCHTVLMEPQWIINAFQDSLLISIRSLDFPGVAPIYCQVWCSCSHWQVQPAVVRRKGKWLCLNIKGCCVTDNKDFMDWCLPYRCTFVWYSMWNRAGILDQICVESLAEQC